MDELAFYNQQFEKYKQYDHKRTDSQALNLANAEDYFQYLVQSSSDLSGTLVDLGCGDGYFTSKLAKLNGSVIGIEPSSLINAANDLLEKSDLNNLQFLKEDAYTLSLDDNSVDVVISRRGPDPADEIHRVLKPDGLFIFITIGEQDAYSLKQIVGRGQHFGSTDKVSEQLKHTFMDAGFTDVMCKDFLYDTAYNTPEALKAFLHQVPIFDNFSESDYPSVDAYCDTHEAGKVTLDRHRVVMIAKKAFTL